MKDHLVAANRAKQERAHAAVVRAVASLVESGETINVYAVHRQAGVARSFIYRRPDLLAYIEQHRQETPRLRQPQQTSSRSSDESLRRRLAGALDRIKDLNAERDELIAQNQALLAENRRLRQRNR